MNNELKAFSYRGNRVTFRRDNGEIMVNLTEMARPFLKDPYGFLRGDQTKRFIEALEKSTPQICGVVKTINGGANPGTWGHRKLALKFAAWLNAEFELWIYDRIDELLRHGVTAINPDNLLDPDLIIRVATELKQEREANRKLSQAVQEAEPKVLYFDTVLRSNTLITTTVIAKDLGMSAQELNKQLHERGIQYQVGGTWVLYQKYQDKGWTGTKTATYETRAGEQKTNIQTYWTEAGRRAILDLFGHVAKTAAV